MNEAGSSKPISVPPIPLTPHQATVHRRRRWAPYLGAIFAAVAMLVATAIPAAAAENMRVTFIRHGESFGNASGLIDTSVPGPVITELGQQQARDVVKRLGDNNYDGIYASSMVRTQLTAAPLSQYLGLPIQVLEGLREFSAGDLEGTPEADAMDLMQYPMEWVFNDNLDAEIPGSINGYQFQNDVNGALQVMYDNGDRNVAAFSHGGTILFWTLMNASNLTAAQKMQLLTGSLSNTDYVVVEGNNEDGWILVDWNGQKFAPEPTFWASLQIQARTLSRQVSAAVQQLSEAFQDLNPANIVRAINRAAADVVFSIVKFNRTVSTMVIDNVENFFNPKPARPTTEDTPVSILAAEDATDDAAQQKVSALSATARATAARAASLGGEGAETMAQQTVAPLRDSIPLEAEPVALADVDVADIPGGPVKVEDDTTAPITSVAVDAEPAAAPTETLDIEAGAPQDALADKGKPLTRGDRHRFSVRESAVRGDVHDSPSAPKRSYSEKKRSAKKSPSAGRDGGSGGARDAA